MSIPSLRRLATPDDLVAVHAIYMHPEVVPYLGIDPAPLEDFRPVFDALLASGAFYVVPRSGGIRGMYRVNRQEGRARHVATLQTLAVAPAERGTGIARAMIEEAIECMRADGILRVELMLEVDNPRALAFYRKLGFEQEGVLRCAYKRSHEDHYIDEIMMGKWLGDFRGSTHPRPPPSRPHATA
jgi:ribosomal protein S18 acetylase RimI-like enzyme